MRIGVVGGGPAGLFFAYLMAKHDRSHRIHVVERDPPDATYGWGVVFTDIALAFVREVDAELYDALTCDQEVHGEMRIVHRGVAVRLANNFFHRMARIHLLQVLHEFCDRVGVQMTFMRRVVDPAEMGECDLLVAADGANSSIRELHRDHFQPALDVRPNKLAWYGTTQLFRPLSLIFRENRDGLLIAHAYRFSRTHSTFLVECDPDTWRAAALDRRSEAESLEYCEEVFREDLDGHKLLSNRSVWFNYAIVANQSWFRGNLVLLGDALRTGHPSIGSGTRLAMQDAIALFHAFASCGPDVPAALAEFERKRRPASDELQAAAIKSTEWYESVRGKLHLDPISFAYDYLRRTGRVSHRDVTRRDPELARAYEALHPGGVRP
jgi:anthraniloyl-CoA monooxygenase